MVVTDVKKKSREGRKQSVCVCGGVRVGNCRLVFREDLIEMLLSKDLKDVRWISLDRIFQAEEKEIPKN